MNMVVVPFNEVRPCRGTFISAERAYSLQGSSWLPKGNLELYRYGFYTVLPLIKITLTMLKDFISEAINIFGKITFSLLRGS